MWSSMICPWNVTKFVVLSDRKQRLQSIRRRLSVGKIFLGLPIPEVYKCSYRCGFVYGSDQKFRLRCFAYATTAPVTSKLSSSFRVKHVGACLDDLANFTLNLAATAKSGTRFLVLSSPNNVRYSRLRVCVSAAYSCQVLRHVGQCPLPDICT
jgi:hypothetical protein